VKVVAISFFLQRDWIFSQTLLDCFCKGLGMGSLHGLHAKCVTTIALNRFGLGKEKRFCSLMASITFPFLKGKDRCAMSIDLGKKLEIAMSILGQWIGM
jgi:hypothetical protein